MPSFTIHTFRRATTWARTMVNLSAERTDSRTFAYRFVVPKFLAFETSKWAGIVRLYWDLLKPSIDLLERICLIESEYQGISPLLYSVSSHRNIVDVDDVLGCKFS